ncbi:MULTISPECIES: hypothetical protein [Eikenella]|uniref:HTH cro/C1-type domain-containing protein n=1 Tax=Eikenella longinqua TaxID=1795827 RepID=A0A1A9RWY5_9NEIS|nr:MULTISPECIES: hypothetical protein [Eikenella]OAM27588.1 hypothetical protein A7P95_06645 [Eikenella longinqua]
MDINDIPQDDSPSYHGHQKIIYGTRNGRYQAATSTGWQDEAYATGQAVAELEAQTQAARQAVARGERSPLYYHMYRSRHDEASLAQAAGVWRWQVRRHMQPAAFQRLPEKILAKYAQALGISLDELRQPF